MYRESVESSRDAMLPQWKGIDYEETRWRHDSHSRDTLFRRIFLFSFLRENELLFRDREKISLVCSPGPQKALHRIDSTRTKSKGWVPIIIIIYYQFFILTGQIQTYPIFFFILFYFIYFLKRKPEVKFQKKNYFKMNGIYFSS